MPAGCAPSTPVCCASHQCNGHTHTRGGILSHVSALACQAQGPGCFAKFAGPLGTPLEAPCTVLPMPAEHALRIERVVLLMPQACARLGPPAWLLSSLPRGRVLAYALTWGWGVDFGSCVACLLGMPLEPPCDAKLGCRCFGSPCGSALACALQRPGCFACLPSTPLELPRAVHPMPCLWLLQLASCHHACATQGPRMLQLPLGAPPACAPMRRHFHAMRTPLATYSDLPRASAAPARLLALCLCSRMSNTYRGPGCFVCPLGTPPELLLLMHAPLATLARRMPLPSHV